MISRNHPFMVVAILVVISAMMFGTLLAQEVFACQLPGTSGDAGNYGRCSAAEVNANIPGFGGGTTAGYITGLETGCRNRLQGYPAYVGSDARQRVNDSFPYTGATWISPAGTPSQSQATIGYGTTNIPLQLNSFRFICAILVNNSDSAKNTPDGSYTNSFRVDLTAPVTAPVTATRYPSDRDIVPYDGASLFEERIRFDSASLTSSPAGCKITSNLAGVTQYLSRNNQSRYWGFNKVPFNVSCPGGIKSTTTIVINAKYRSISGFHPVREYICATPDGSTSHDVGKNDWGSCFVNSVSYAIKLNVTNESFILTPSVTADGASSGVVISGGTVNFKYNVAKTGAGDATGITTTIRRFRINPNFSGVINESTSCSNNSNYSCAETKGKPQLPDSYSNGNNPINFPDSVNTANDPIGTRYCRILGVSPARKDAAGNVTSANAWATECVTVAARPLVQVRGYDLRVEKSILTASPNGPLAGRYYGSWGEYGALAGKSIQGFASGAGLRGGNPSTTTLNRLTFANTGLTTCAPSNLGCYGTIAAPSTLINTLVSRCNVQGWQNNATVGGGTYSSATYVCARGMVTISGNITLGPGNTSSASALPQVVIVARDIVIDPGVSTVNAWLIATKQVTNPASSTGGRVSTCSNVRAGSNYFQALGTSNLLAASSCGTPLTITGPVVADQLFLYRTAVPGVTGNPAETLNLRPDAFLWADNGGGFAGVFAQTMSVKELPPRF